MADTVQETDCVDLVVGAYHSAQDAGTVVMRIALVQGILSLSGRG